LTSAITPISAPAPVVQVSSTTADDSNASQIATLQKLLTTLQKQKSETASKEPGKLTTETTEISEQISGVQSQIAMLQQQANRKAEQAEENKQVENRTQTGKPPPKSPEKVLQEQEERDALATAKNTLAGLTIGTNVDTYA
jgi:hypothetical protein